jgi:acyl-CoA dehydrogenase
MTAASTCGFTPVIAPAKMLDDPQVALEIVRHLFDWLASNAAGLEPEEQKALARRVGVASGLYAAEFPVEHGGWSLPERVAVDVREEAAASGLWYSRFALTSFHGPTRILLDGTDEQKARWLRPLVEGRWTRCLAMTEESGGSHLGALETTAKPSAGGGWRLSGRKFMIGNAAQADVAIVLADAEAGGAGPRGAGQRGAGGPTFFVFTTDTPGWDVQRRLPGMDPHYLAYDVVLDGIEVDADAVIGGPGSVGGAIGKVSEWMAFGRLAMAARAVGLSRYAWGIARDYARQRHVAGGRLSDKQYIREFLVRSDVKIEASRSLVRQAAQALDDGRVAVREAAIAKLHATESACEIIDDAIQTLGARGWLSEYGLEQTYREARAFRIADGSSEVLKETIFHLPPEAAAHGGAR